MEISLERGESLTVQVHRALRRAIIAGDLAPGSLHSMAKLAERLDVSRSPVREALITLADQGMVAFERNRGVRILETTSHDLEEVFSLRLLLEVPATYRATQAIGDEGIETLREALGHRDAFVSAPSMVAHQEMDSRFHRAILRAAGNARLVNVVDNLWSHQKARGVSSAGRSRELGDIFREHQVVFERMEAGDPVGAATAMRDHLANSARLLLAQESGDSVEAVASALEWLDLLGSITRPASDE